MRRLGKSASKKRRLLNLQPGWIPKTPDVPVYDVVGIEALYPVLERMADFELNFDALCAHKVQTVFYTQKKPDAATVEETHAMLKARIEQHVNDVVMVLAFVWNHSQKTRLSVSSKKYREDQDVDLYEYTFGGDLGKLLEWTIHGHYRFYGWVSHGDEPMGVMSAWDCFRSNWLSSAGGWLEDYGLDETVIPELVVHNYACIP